MPSADRPTTTRRTALKSFAGLIGISGLATRGKASEPTTEITTIKRGDEVLRTKTVSEKWYNEVQEARKRVTDLQDQLLTTPGVKWIGYTFGSEYIRDRTRPQLKIATQSSRLNQEIPDSVGSFDVVTEDVGGSDVLCMNQGDFDPVPAGVTVEGTGLYGISGTSGPEVDNSNGNTHLLTANHLIGRCGAGSDTQTLQQNGDDFGTVSESDGDEDWAIVDPNSSFSTKSTVEQGTDGELDISGYYTQDGVDDLGCYASTGECKTVISMGTTTGRTYGTVQERGVLRDKCPSMNGFGLRLYMESAKGDSGGLTYGREEFNGTTYAVMLNIVNAGETENGTVTCGGQTLQEYKYQHGIPLFHLKNAHGIS